MRPTPLDELPQAAVHVQIGYVAYELAESVKIMYELAVKLRFSQQISMQHMNYGQLTRENVQ